MIKDLTFIKRWDSFMHYPKFAVEPTVPHVGSQLPYKIIVIQQALTHDLRRNRAMYSL